jgi:cell division protein FtsZ
MLFCAPCTQAATSAPLIERSIERATGIVYNITGGKDLTLQEVNRVSEVGHAGPQPSDASLGVF